MQRRCARASAGVRIRVSIRARTGLVRPKVGSHFASSGKQQDQHYLEGRFWSLGVTQMKILKLGQPAKLAEDRKIIMRICLPQGRKAPVPFAAPAAGTGGAARARAVWSCSRAAPGMRSPAGSKTSAVSAGEMSSSTAHTARSPKHSCIASKHPPFSDTPHSRLAAYFSDAHVPSRVARTLAIISGSGPRSASCGACAAAPSGSACRCCSCCCCWGGVRPSQTGPASRDLHKALTAAS